MGGPHHRFAPLLSRPLRRIPQAVSTVATKNRFQTPELLYEFQYRKR